MRALSLITIKPGTIDKVTELLSKKRKIAKEILPVTGRADICVLMHGPIDDINTTVESFFQGSKVFEGGGPFTDLYFKESIQAKKDTRLNENGELKYFEYKGEKWKLEENFYSWVYLLGLYQNENIKELKIKTNLAKKECQP